MYEVMPHDSASTLGDRLQRLLHKDAPKKDATCNSLRRSLFLFCFWTMLKNGLVLIVEQSLIVLAPVLIGKIIECYSPDQAGISFQTLILYTSGACLQAWVVAFTQNSSFLLSTRMGMNVKVAVSDIIYTKAVSLDMGALQRVTTGYVINLMSTDVQKLEMMLLLFNYMWVGPLQLIAVTTLLWPDLGPSCLAGTSLILLLIPLNLYLGKILSRSMILHGKLTDERVSLLAELIKGINVVKMYAWEMSFWTRITTVRKRELVQKARILILNMVAIILYMALPNLVCVATFATFRYTSSAKLTVPLVFKALSLYRLARLTQVYFFLLSAQFFAEGLVAIKRIQRLLDVAKSPNPGYSKLEPCIESDPQSLTASGVDCSWEMDAQGSTLKDLCFEVKKGSLTMISGPVGSGKSSLLLAILGELPLRLGTVKVNGKLAYCSQQAWIFPGTVRQNILLGKPYDKSRYDEVVAACSLEQDFKLWPSGDLTSVGAGGASLSGGQKARLVLARTAYTEADIYLLDDPLSALDTRVGNHVFDRLLCGFLRKKTLIVVTHLLHTLDRADQVLLMDKGSIVGQGPLSSLVQQHLALVSLLSSRPQGDKGLLPSESMGEDPQNNNGLDECSAGVQAPSSSLVQVIRKDSFVQMERSASKLSQLMVQQVQLPVTVAEDVVDNDMEEEEQVHSGVVSAKVYRTYLYYGAGYFIILMFFYSIIIESMLVATNWWLGVWAESEECFNSTISCYTAPGANQTLSNLVRNYLIENRSQNIGIIVLSLLAMLGLFTVASRSYIFMRIGIRASRSLHSKMLHSIVNAPLFFFGLNTPGKIINRFSKDTFFLDGPLPSTAEDCLVTTIECVSAIVMNIVSQPYLLIAMVPLGSCFYFVQRLFLSSSRQIKRLESIARSPMFGYLNSSLQGLVSVRAAGFQQNAIGEFRQCLDHHTKSYFSFILLTRWFALRIDLLSALFITIALFIPVISVALSKAVIDQTVLGLSFMYAISITGYLQWAVRQSSEVENQMTSVERVLEFVDVPGEKEHPDAVEPPGDWPQLGAIFVDGVDYRHDTSLPPVLKQLVFSINSHEKVGIVGRTGAGKSSLLSMFLRMGDVEGRVFVDGINLATVPLRTLRSRVSIIPQDPLLFSGSLRQNLDPFQLYSDAEIWNALAEVHMRESVVQLEGGLEIKLVEFGANFSVGQRQLLCLARALLRRSRILFMDEATANIDIKTDKLIHDTIKTKFSECSVLTVAHRLQTVMECDRIMVLHEGRIMEFDEPSVLLQRTGSHLRSMADQTGPEELARLLAIAAEAAERRRRLSSSHAPDVVVADAEPLGWKRLSGENASHSPDVVVADAEPLLTYSF